MQEKIEHLIFIQLRHGFGIVEVVPVELFHPAEVGFLRTLLQSFQSDEAIEIDIPLLRGDIVVRGVVSVRCLVVVFFSCCMFIMYLFLPLY